MSTKDPLLPRGEGLRQALRWLSEQGEITSKTVEQASRQYNLSPLEEDFLIRKFLQEKNNRD